LLNSNQKRAFLDAQLVRDVASAKFVKVAGIKIKDSAFPGAAYEGSISYTTPGATQKAECYGFSILFDAAGARIAHTVGSAWACRMTTQSPIQ
jgi:hypothetical protein